MIGQTISHYKILGKLGEGGMGVVYRAHDTKLGRDVALKFLPRDLSLSEEDRTRFTHEAKAASALDHPNICTIYEIDETPDGQMFIVMGYYQGTSLSSKVEKGRLGVAEAVWIAIQIAEGLQAAHEKGIVHRDIKSSNIIVSDKGQVRILDFGLARKKGLSKLTRIGTTMGTISYMSPEQTRGESIDQRTDIWSLGVVLYEMVTGQLPFRGEYEQAVVYCILNDEPPSILDVRKEIPVELAQAVEKALAKKPEERYQCIEEVLADLRIVGNQFETADAKTISDKRVLPSIAVLPLVNMSADPEQEYFCDGMTEELINALSKIENLHIPARTSAFAFKGVKIDVREIGRKLNVATVLEGSVRKAGNRLRITAQLINVANGYHLWSERFDRELDDVFAIQDEISMTIVSSLKVQLLRGEKEKRLQGAKRTDPEAYQMYLKGLYHLNKRTSDELKRAVDWFNQAIEKDPGYALAYAGLAQTYAVFPEIARFPTKEYLPMAEAAARRALELDENVSEAHSVIGLVNMLYAWDWSGAERELKKAIELNPNHPTAHHWYSIMLYSEGRLDETMSEIKRALELDPLSLIINVNAGLVLHFMRRYDDAIEQHKNTLELDQNYAATHVFLGNVYCQKGMVAEAIAECQKASLLIGSSHRFELGWLGYAYARCGMVSEAEQVLIQLLAFSRQGYIVSHGIALVYNGLGKMDEALEWLEKAFEDHDTFVRVIKVDPALDNLRSKPRFIALLQKMGLEK